MEQKIIALFVVIVILAGVGGYVLGLYQGAGNFTLNVTNNTTDNGSGISTKTSTTPKITNTAKNTTPVKNNTKPIINNTTST